MHTYPVKPSGTATGVRNHQLKRSAGSSLAAARLAENRVLAAGQETLEVGEYATDSLTVPITDGSEKCFGVGHDYPDS